MRLKIQIMIGVYGCELLWLSSRSWWWSPPLLEATEIISNFDEMRRTLNPSHKFRERFPFVSCRWLIIIIIIPPPKKKVISYTSAFYALKLILITSGHVITLIKWENRSNIHVVGGMNNTESREPSPGMERRMPFMAPFFPQWLRIFRVWV